MFFTSFFRAPHPRFDERFRVDTSRASTAWRPL
jgi:hypothetical protein